MNTHQILRGILRGYRLYSPFRLKRTVSLHSKELSTNNSLNHQMMQITKEIKDMNKMCHNYVKDPNTFKFQDSQVLPVTSYQLIWAFIILGVVPVYVCYVRDRHMAKYY
tara:strand:- start:34 stop:360 length:327 start_codon:yes stop_codon:yes gene_type:complete